MLEINKFNKIIVANWKLNGSKDFIDDYFEVLANYNSLDPSICGVICPPSVYLEKCSSKKNSIYLGAQNCSNYNIGAYTGEVSALMLGDMNCKFCIVGHSERRQILKEKNIDIKEKAYTLIENNIVPIICIGETLTEKNEGKTKDVLFKQISNSTPLNSSHKGVIFAYEPIWAIGTGLTPTLEEIEIIHGFIKNEIHNFEKYKVLYGGSVKPNNSKEIMTLNNVDGLLVGGSSLEPLDFIKILKS